MKRFATSSDPVMRVARNSGWLLWARVATAVSSLIYLALATRWLGPADFGRFILIVSTVMIVVALFRPQTWQPLVHFAAPMLAKREREQADGVFWWSLAIELAGGLVAMALLLLLAGPVGAQFGWSQEMVAGLWLYGLLALPAIRATPLGQLRLYDRFREGSIADWAVSAVRLVGSLAAVLIAPTVTSFLIVWALSEIAAAATLFWYVWRTSPVGKPRFGKLPSGFWSFLLATNASYILVTLRERGVVLVVGLVVSASAAGLFRLADQLANSVNRLTEIFAKPLFTELAQMQAAGDRAGASALFWRSLKIAGGAGIGMFLLLVALGQPLILLMSGEAYLPAYPVLLILGAATIIGLIGFGVEPLLQATGRAGQAFWIRFAGLALLGGLLWLWLPAYGMLGAGWAMLAASGVTVLAMLFAGWRALRHG